MNRESLITIIIPMFNESSNIQECLNVLRSQSEQDFSVIFIDDGSTDNTINILEKELFYHPPIFTFLILKQENLGAAKARKLGITKAKTPYVFLYDCDDALSHDAIEKTLENISKYNHPDISLLNMYFQDQNGNCVPLIYNLPEKKILNGHECLLASLGSWGIHGSGAYKKKLFIESYKIYDYYNALSLNYVNNDEVLTRLNFSIANTISLNTGSYFYKENHASTTRKLNKNKYLMLKNAIILYLLFSQNSKDLALAVQTELLNTLWHIRSELKNNKKDLSNKKEWKTEIRNTISFILSKRKEMNLNNKDVSRLIRRYISLTFI